MKVKSFSKLIIRLYPAALGSTRITQDDIVLCNYHVPAGVCTYTHNAPLPYRINYGTNGILHHI